MGSHLSNKGSFKNPILVPNELIKDSQRYKNYGSEFNRFKIVIPKVLQTGTNEKKIL